MCTSFKPSLLPDTHSSSYLLGDLSICVAFCEQHDTSNFIRTGLRYISYSCGEHRSVRVGARAHTHVIHIPNAHRNYFEGKSKFKMENMRLIELKVGKINAQNKGIKIDFLRAGALSLVQSPILFSPLYRIRGFCFEKWFIFRESRANSSRYENFDFSNLSCSHSSIRSYNKVFLLL